MIMTNTIVKSSWNGIAGKLSGRDTIFLGISGYPPLKSALCLPFVTRGFGSVSGRWESRPDIGAEMYSKIQQTS